MWNTNISKLPVDTHSAAWLASNFQYADESDQGPYPFGPDTPIEGGAQAGGDRHAIMVNPSTCTLSMSPA
jgi:hypothetical protein